MFKKSYLCPQQSTKRLPSCQDEVWAGLPDHRLPWLIKWFLQENEIRAFWTVVRKTVLSRAIIVQAWE